MTTFIIIVFIIILILIARGVDKSNKQTNAKVIPSSTEQIISQPKVFSTDDRRKVVIEDITSKTAYRRIDATQASDNSIIDISIDLQNVDIPKYPAVDSVADAQLPTRNESIFYTDFSLGKLYKEKLKLSPQEVSWLNKFWNSTNVFIGIEGCCIETIKLYLATLKELNKHLKTRETTIAKEVSFFQVEIVQLYKANNTPYWGEYDNSYVKERVESEIFSTIFKRAEKVVREVFDHKRKLSGDFPYSDETIVHEFDQRIGLTVNGIIQKLRTTVAKPDEQTETALNAQNISRWKITFEKLVASFSETTKGEFIDGVRALEKSNQKNPSIESIFFEASKFTAKYDKIEALKFYIQYLYYDLKSERVDNKQLTKTIQKSLFTTNEQLHEFEKVVAELITTKNLDNAIVEVTKIYRPKRRRITLDSSVIKEVVQQDHGTVALLSEYLKDEFEDDAISVKSQEINSEEIELDISSKTDKQVEHAVVGEVALSDVQSATLTLFVEKSFVISTYELESYCKQIGVFKNQLINSINESCYDTLDDLLIEEDDEQFTINENYYRKISQS